MLKDVKKLLKLMGKYKWSFFPIVVLASLLQAPRETIKTEVFREIIDYFVYQKTSLHNTIILAILFVLLSVVIGPLIMYFVKSIMERVMRNIRIFAYDKVKKMTIRFYDKFHSGDIVSRLNNDVDDMEWAMGVHEVLGFHIVASCIVIPYFITIDWRLAAVVVVSNFIAAFVNVKFAMPIRHQSWKMSQKLAKLSEILTENITGLKIVKMFGLKKYFIQKMESGMNEFYSSEKDFIKTETKMIGINNLIHALSFGVVTVFAAYLVINKQILVGAFAGTVMLSSNLSFHFLRIGQNITFMQRTYASVDRLYQLLDEEMEPKRYETASEDHTSGISITNGYFEYVENDHVINDLNIKVPVGKMAALVGDSGGGKSTAIKLILALYPLKSGQMTINAKPVCEYTLDELREQMAYVPQDAYIFNGTIRQNILYGKEDATVEEFNFACEKAHIDEFALKQPAKYETLVGERGIKLSGGQKQRIAIARAIIKNAPILLLDEATSSLDSESEFFIQESLEALMKGKTSLVVAHRLSTIEKADIIYYIKDGCVVEEGTHNQLLELNKYYAELYYRDFAEKTKI
ncbi:MAG: ABC transporter ATP-binding protein [Clostridia bacterium]|nr:ABC transporter ATP-binding protein [Clostridia bacterium]